MASELTIEPAPSSTDGADSGHEGAPRGRRAELRLASLVLCVGMGALVVVLLFAAALRREVSAVDFSQFYAAAKAILQGQSPYAGANAIAPWGGPYPYPPLPAILAAPLTLLSADHAGIVVMATLVVVALAVPFVLGVRDWRCFGIALVWPPVISAIQTGNVTLWFALACALSWRYRDRALPVAVSLGLTLATKFYLWPLLLWLVATRRALAALLALVVGTVLLLGSWATIGFAGLTGYPELLRRLNRVVGDDSYSAYIVGRDLGAPAPVARALWLAIGLGLLVLLVVLARRGDERSAFIVAIAASLALTPIVWLHYFALLLVVVAVAQRTLGLLWFLPLGMVLTPGSGHPTPFETAWTLGVAVVTIALALRMTTRAHPTTAPRVRAALGKA